MSFRSRDLAKGGFADEGISFSIFRNSIYFGGTSGVELGTRRARNEHVEMGFEVALEAPC